MSKVTIAVALSAARQASLDILDAEVLLAHVLGVKRAYIFAYPEKMLSPAEWSLYQEYITACAHGMPVAYIIGFREFWSIRLRVTSDTLIPRPETECLVEQALLCVPSPKAIIADVGTGSGAIALALAHERPNWHIHATDCCEKALLIAKENASRLNKNTVYFHQGDGCSALPPYSFDMILSNPPYLAEGDEHLATLRHEPKGALVSGVDGLDMIRILISEARHFLRADGWLLIEHGWDQGEAVKNIFIQNGFFEVKTVKDMSGRSRVTKGQKRE